MESLHVEDLSDRVGWIAASIELQTTADDEALPDVFKRIAFYQARIAKREDTPFKQLAERFTLSETEQHVLMLLLAVRRSSDVQARVRQVAMAAEPTLDTIRNLIYGTAPSLAAFEDLASTGTLRRFALIERNDEHGVHAHESKQTWTLAPRVLSMLHGRNAIDAALVKTCRVREPMAMTDIATSAEAIELARSAMRGEAAVVVATGMPGLGRRSLLVAAAAAAGHRVLEIDARRLAKEASALTQQLRAVIRECKLFGATPLIANLDALDEERTEIVGAELSDGMVLVTCGMQRPRIDWGRPKIVVEMKQPTSAQRATLWRRALGGISAQDVEHLATHYPLAPALIDRAAKAAKARAAGRALDAGAVYAGIRAVLDDGLGQYAKRVTVTQTWDDLVLPQEQVDAITELMARIRERRRVYEDWGFAAKVGKGLGTSALFSGPPGTGKTMVAALIANDLGLELYQVDLGKVVSKYIGETEKNLAALFDAAEAGHAVLLFDEADSLFGKRTEVKSSNDRYANLETNYLLQRLESFTGICLLTSNHETNIDPAFLRRLSLHLRFELPDAEERAHLWRAMLPKQAPVDGNVDVEQLAKRYAMSGGYIRNAALRAAFLAANDDSAITVAHLERAARSEYEGMGKIVAS